jgi:hypothetical protein
MTSPKLNTPARSEPRATSREGELTAPLNSRLCYPAMDLGRRPCGRRAQSCVRFNDQGSAALNNQTPSRLEGST